MALCYLALLSVSLCKFFFVTQRATEEIQRDTEIVCFIYMLVLLQILMLPVRSSEEHFPPFRYLYRAGMVPPY
jgi:uncharacterized membrane protein